MRHLPSECARVLPWPTFAIPQVRPVAPRMRDWWRPARGERGRAHRLGHTKLSPSRLVCMPRPSPHLAVLVLLRAICLPRGVLRADVHDATQPCPRVRASSPAPRSGLGCRPTRRTRARTRASASFLASGYGALVPSHATFPAFAGLIPNEQLDAVQVPSLSPIEPKGCISRANRCMLAE